MGGRLKLLSNPNTFCLTFLTEDNNSEGGLEEALALALASKQRAWNEADWIWGGGWVLVGEKQMYWRCLVWHIQVLDTPQSSIVTCTLLSLPDLFLPCFNSLRLGLAILK